jgi:fermentation-respiration switch protein FrsA (DUF1100 family)
LKTLLIALVLGYAGIACIVWLVQERLLFYPRAALGAATPPPGWRLSEVMLTTRDGTLIAGVLALPAVERPPLVIYFGGNAEEVTAYAPHVAEVYGERAVLLVNYRGYGASGGSPGERAIVADAAELHDWVSREAPVDATRVAIHGRSLGSGVAVQLAAARPVKCVVLTSPFASALDVGREMYPWLPVALLLRHPFDSAARAPGLRVPLLVLVGEADRLIAPHHSERLAGLWGGPVERVNLPGFGHNDLDLDPRYAQAIRAFLDRHL